MGLRETNFYVDLTHRFGFGEVADEVQSLYLDGKREEAFAATLYELVDATSMIGSEDEVAERVKQFRLIVSPVQATPEERLHRAHAALVGAVAPA